ncbi:MAG: RNA polymerase sigma factor [Acidimicrobiia bacterium]
MRGRSLFEPDPNTIRAAAKGDTAAFEELMRAYQAPVWRFLRHLLRDASLAEDVTQETFIRVYRRLHTFRFRSKFSTWVFQVARNAGIDALRARERRSRLLQVVRPERVVPDPSARLEISEALSRLTPMLREAFLMIEVLGLTYRESGRALGVPEGTVKSRVFRAREQLVAWLGDQGEQAHEV